MLVCKCNTNYDRVRDFNAAREQHLLAVRLRRPRQPESPAKHLCDGTAARMRRAV